MTKGLYLWEHKGELSLQVGHSSPPSFTRVKAMPDIGITSLWGDNRGHNTERRTCMTCAGKTQAVPPDTYFRKIQRTMKQEWIKATEFLTA